jgi:hypothetical protein
MRLPVCSTLGWRCPAGKSNHSLNGIAVSLQQAPCGIVWQRSFIAHGSSGNSLESRSATVDVAVPAQAGRKRGGSAASLVPGFDAQQLLGDMQLDGYGSADELSASMGKLPGIRQQGILQHGPQVAAHLRGLGIESSELGSLFCRCPYLFSRPAEERAGVLLSQLMRLGLSAGQAAHCFEQQPQAAASMSFEPAIAVLAPLLAAGSKGGGRTGEQLLGNLLKGQPGAVGLLQHGAAALQHNLDNLLQLGLSKRQVATALLPSWCLLGYSPQHLARLEAVVQQELGSDRQLWVKVLVSQSRMAGCSEATLRQRAQALAAVSDCVWWLAACMACADGGGQSMHCDECLSSPAACCQPSIVVLLTLNTCCLAGVWQGRGMQDG